MKLALAQIDVRLGDVDAICARIGDQMALAARAGARLLCTPAPLLSGLVPGTLVEYANFEHELLRGLQGIADEAGRVGVACLVPAAVTCGNGPYFEAFLLRDGHVTPFRLALLRAREGTPVDPWLPPVFDLDGLRVAATFDFERDITRLPPGCDVLVSFQVNPFNHKDVSSTAVAAVCEGGSALREAAAQAGVWVAHMAPVGAFDDVVYTGGSYVLDDAGRVVAAAPCFEEALLVQEVRRGSALPALDVTELPAYREQEWLWSALRLHLADSVRAAGASRVMVPLTGSLPSALLAALAVDALGPRNVLALYSERPDAVTPAEEAAERARCARVREVAARLHLRLVEHGAGDLALLFDRPVARREVARLRGEVEALQLIDAAHALEAFPLSPLCKTDYALAASAHAGRAHAALAPFGDLYLSDLEFLARARNRSSAVVPAALASPKAVEEAMAALVRLAADSCGGGKERSEQVRGLLGSLGATEIDGVLAAHVDRNLGFEDIPLSGRAPAATALVLMLVRGNEAARRMLPPYPIVSARSFTERSWPVALGWSDLGRRGAAPLTLEAAATAALERFEHRGEERNELVRDEVFDLIGGIIGLSPEQIEELHSEEGQRRIQEGMQRFEEQLREVFEQLEDEGGLSEGLDLPGSLGPLSSGPGAAPDGGPSFSAN